MLVRSAIGLPVARPLEQLTGAGAEHPLDQRLAEPDRLVGIAANLVVDVLAAIGKPGVAADQQDAVVMAGADADRRVAARFEPGDDGALGGQLDQRLPIGEAGRGGGGRTGVIAGLERERALSRRRGQRPQAEAEAGLAAAAEPLEAGRGEDEPVDLAAFALAQPRVDVAAELDDVEVGADGEQLRAAADARGSDPRPLGNLGDRLARPDPDVGRVRARRDAGERDAVG